MIRVIEEAQEEERKEDKVQFYIQVQGSHV